MSLDPEEPQGLRVTRLTVQFWCPEHNAPLAGDPIWFAVDLGDGADERGVRSKEWDADTSEMWCPKAPENEEETLHGTQCVSSWMLVLT